MSQRSPGKTIKIIRSLEQVKWHYWKFNEDNSFIKSCKKEYLLPKFAIVRLSTRNGSMRLKKKNWSLNSFITEVSII